VIDEVARLYASDAKVTAQLTWLRTELGLR